MNANGIGMTFWDIDGLFVDTEELHFEAWQMLVKEFGKVLSRQAYVPFVGHGSKENMEAICNMLGIVGDYDALRERRRKYFATLRIKDIPVLYENVCLARQFATEFPTIRRAAVSSAPRSDVEENLEVCGLKDIFEFAVSFEDAAGLKLKPAPDLYLYALTRADIPASQVLVFEDSQSGILSAKAAGLRCVALPNALTVNLDLSKADLTIRPGEKKDAKAILGKIAEETS